MLSDYGFALLLKLSHKQKRPRDAGVFVWHEGKIISSDWK
jgi:hypothetical protein